MPAGAKGSDAPAAENTFYTFKEMKGKGEAAKWTWKTLLN